MECSFCKKPAGFGRKGIVYATVKDTINPLLAIFRKENNIQYMLVLGVTMCKYYCSVIKIVQV